MLPTRFPNHVKLRSEDRAARIWSGQAMYVQNRVVDPQANRFLLGKRRRMTTARAVIGIGLVLLAGSGCAHRLARRDLDRWEQGLELSVSASPLTAGKSVPVELRL